MRAAEARELLARLGVRPSRRLGQTFLLDERVARRQVVAASVRPGDTVLEIGPGLGMLTAELLAAGASVVAVEKDRRFASYLVERFPTIRLIQADALKVNLPVADKVVANLPYSITSPLLFRLLDRGFDVAVLLVQREVAQRIVAVPGTRDYGRLTVGVAYRARAEIVERVPRRAFWPQPEVDSAVVRLQRHPPPVHVEDEELFFHVVNALFSHRRKKIAHGLAAGFSRPGARVPRWNDVPYFDRRVEELGLEEIAHLSNELARRKVHPVGSG